MNIKKLSVFILLAILQLLVVQFVRADGTLVHEYTFANAWSSSTPVTDNIGNSNGNVVGQVSRVTNASFGGLTNTCFAADFTNGHIRLDDLNIDQDSDANPEPTTITFWMRWEGNNNQMPFAWTRYDLWLRDNSFGFNHWQSNVYGISSNALDSQWVHVAAVFHNRDFFSNELYINGIKQTLTDRRNRSSATGGQVWDTLSIGAHRTSGNSDNYEFGGQIANFRIYRGVITESQVTQDMQNISGACGTSISGPTVEYRFDNFHNSTAGSVLDSSGNDNHGTAFTASNAQGLLCTAADFSTPGDANYIVANRQALNGLSDFTAMAWIKTDQTNASTIFSAASSDSSLGANEAVFYFDNANQFWPTITASPFNASTRLGTTSNINDGQWHQVVWTRQAATRESCFFVDGIAQGCVTHDDGDDTSPISVANGGLVIGQEQDSLGGEFEVNQSFDGLMDEFMIFDYVMSQASINTINNNIRSNKNWDGTPRAECAVAFPIVDLRFDENSWNGNGSVLDSSGSGYNGTPFGTAAPISGLSCNALNLRATGIADYVALSNQGVNGLQDFSIVFWGKIEGSNNMAAISGARGSQNNELLMFFQPQNSRIRAFIKGQARSFNTTFDNEWHQYAWTREASTGRNCLYKDGIEISCNSNFSKNPLNISENGLILGQEQDNVGGGFQESQAWNGLIDEFLIFPAVLTAAEIQEYRQNILDGNDWRGLPKACNDTVDHYRFEFSANGLTCAASNITLRACEDSSCSNEATINTSLDLSPANKWTGNDVTGSSANFTGSTGLFLSQNTLGTIAIGASNLNPAPSSATPVQCYNGSTAINCEIAFKDTGFSFSQIPLQISNKPSDEEFNGRILTIKAVEKNTTTGACQNVFPADTDVDIDLRLNCHYGACNDAHIKKDNASNEVNINGSYTPVTLRFNNDSTANYILRYPDAGELSLSARKQVTLPSGPLATLEDTSNQFIVKPFGFRLQNADSNEDAHSDGNPNGDFSKFKKAGESFAVQAIPIAWQDLAPGETEDADLDGKIDPQADTSGNTKVGNFNNQWAVLSYAKNMPAAGVLGTLKGGLERQVSGDSADFENLTYDEVGIIDLQVNLKAPFLGVLDGDVVGYMQNVGRFYPDRFEVVTDDVVAGDLTGQCIAQTFIGEMANGNGTLKYYSTNPSMKIRPMAVGGTEPLKNYQAPFDLLTAANITFDATISANGLDVASSMNIGTLVKNNGEMTYTMSDDDRYYYVRNSTSKVDQFDAGLNFPVDTITDSDGVALTTSVALSAASTAGHKMVYGRIKLHNAFGPDNQALAMPVEHQRYNGTEFVTNTVITNTVIDTGCSYPVTPSSDFTLGTSPFGDVTASSLTTPLIWQSGLGRLLIPASNLSGELPMEMDVPTWLRFDWDNNPATVDTNPSANAVFGRYRGNDRVINWRERR